jgi:hypothetical protein
VHRRGTGFTQPSLDVPLQARVNAETAESLVEGNPSEAMVVLSATELLEAHRLRIVAGQESVEGRVDLCIFRHLNSLARLSPER